MVTLIIHLAVYPYLPVTVPYHWDINGHVDRTGHKSIELIIAIIPFLLYLLMSYKPKFDPKKEAYRKHKKAYSIFVFVTILFFSCLSFVVLLISMGYSIPIVPIFGGILGGLTIVLGNYMRQIRQNYFFGIKTP